MIMLQAWWWLGFALSSFAVGIGIFSIGNLVVELINWTVPYHNKNEADLIVAITMCVVAVFAGFLGLTFLEMMGGFEVWKAIFLY